MVPCVRCTPVLEAAPSVDLPASPCAYFKSSTGLCASCSCCVNRTNAVFPLQSHTDTANAVGSLPRWSSFLSALRCVRFCHLCGDRRKVLEQKRKKCPPRWPSSTEASTWSDSLAKAREVCIVDILTSRHGADSRQGRNDELHVQKDGMSTRPHSDVLQSD